MSKTKVFTNEQFNGKTLFKIYKVDDDGKKTVEFNKKTGEKKETKPVFNFGIIKANILIKHLSELEEFIKESE